MVADAIGVELDEIVCEAEFAQTTEDVVAAPPGIVTYPDLPLTLPRLGTGRSIGRYRAMKRTRSTRTDTTTTGSS